MSDPSSYDPFYDFTIHFICLLRGALRAAEGLAEEAGINAWSIIHPDEAVAIRVARSGIGRGIVALPLSNRGSA
jgi:hypothetical protein